MNTVLLADPRPETETELISYSYSYPHKSSYRPLHPPQPLEDVWKYERRENLALYVHLPFCEMRCGFCNLFTQSQPEDEVVEAYLRTLRRQMHVVRDRVGTVGFEQFAIGGGTPTYLSASELAGLLADVEDTFRLRIADLHTSVETSPSTATPERLAVLAAFGVERVSLGIQSLQASDLARMGRPQQTAEVFRALKALRAAQFPILNVDLIYGGPLQTVESWVRTLDAVLEFSPEELFLYPLYVRPGTGLARVGRSAAEHRGDLYRAGRERLLSHGYNQVSLRCFRRTQSTRSAARYTCQSDGMIGLGCGARSYTRSLHYGTRFATTQAGVRAILRDWIQQPDVALGQATHGVFLNPEEERRRFVILSLLQVEGLARVEYTDQFGSTPEEDLPELAELRHRGWLVNGNERLLLTDEGLQHSDSVGPMLYSEAVRTRLREFVRL